MRNDWYFSSQNPQGPAAQTGDLKKREDGKQITLKLTLAHLTKVALYDFVKNNPCEQIEASQAVWKIS